jgi:predicted phosphodiesterase
MPKFTLLHISDLHLSTRPQRLGVADLLEEGIYLPEDERHRLSSRARKLSSTFLQQFVFAREPVGILASHDEEVLERLAEAIYFWRDGFDAIAVAGDLATSGSRPNLRLAFDFFTLRSNDDESPWLTGRRSPALTISGVTVPGGWSVGKPIWIVHGNHDRYNTRRLYLPGGKALREIFRRDDDNPEREMEHVSFPLDDTRVERLGLLEKEGYALCCIAADFSLRSYFDCDGGHSYLGQGKVHLDVLEQLKDLTAQTRREFGRRYRRLVFVWLLHYPPAYPYPEGYPQAKARNLALRSEGFLIEAANELDVSLLLAGHTHRADAYDADRELHKPRVVCTGSTTQQRTPARLAGSESGNDCCLIEIDFDETSVVDINPIKIVFDEANSEWVFPATL